MTTGKKLIIASLILGTIAVTIGYAVNARSRGVVAVEMGKALRQELAQSVTANGEIKPKKYVNISSNSFGRIVDMPVAEGDKVEDNQLLLQIESIQTQADVLSAEASLDAAASELEGMDASIRSAEASRDSTKAELSRIEADYRRSSLEFDRAKALYEGGLISKERFDGQEAGFEIAVAQVEAGKARIVQAEAQLAQVFKQKDGLRFRMTQQEASLTRALDQLAKTTINAPLAGVITYLPVNEGEIAIVGVQNQPGTTLMTIADMSVITAEVRVDETDIINLKLGQLTEVRVDALGDRTLSGFVSEIGNSALTSSGGISTTTTNTDEARDFKVVITLDDPPPELRPGLSCTATIVTAKRDTALTVPIQALTIREIDEADVPSFVDNPVYATSRPGEPVKVEQEGVFVIQNGVATFQPVKTGIVGTTDIEILDGLNDDQEIVIGSYRVLRTLEDEVRIKAEEDPSP
jgi:HlyD family secretion protein